MHLPPTRCGGRWAPRPQTEGNAHRSSNGSNKEESKRSRGGKNPSEVPFENKETALSARSNHPWLSSARVAKFFVFSPWGPHWGVSALAAHAGGAGRRERRDEGCGAQLCRVISGPRETPSAPPAAGASGAGRAATGRSRQETDLTLSGVCCCWRSLTTTASRLFSPLCDGRALKEGRQGVLQGPRPLYGICFLFKLAPNKTPLGKPPPKLVETFNRGSK